MRIRNSRSNFSQTTPPETAPRAAHLRSHQGSQCDRFLVEEENRRMGWSCFAIKQLPAQVAREDLLHDEMETESSTGIRPLNCVDKEKDAKHCMRINTNPPHLLRSATTDLQRLQVQMEGSDFTEEVTEATEIYINAIGKKKIFVAGATGSTGKRIVERLLAKGFRVKAGVRDLDKAKTSLPQDNPALQIVKADVTEGSAKLADAISDDSEAVICATGCRSGWDLYAPWKVDNLGTVNLVDACRKLGVKRFILVSSLLVNGAAMGQILNPAYIFLNVFGLTLIAKLRAEDYIRESGMNYTIIRPGGLRNEPPTGNLVMEPEDTLYEGTISRDQVAEVAIEALVRPQASYKVVEIVARADAPKRSYGDLFSSITQR